MERGAPPPGAVVSFPPFDVVELLPGDERHEAARVALTGPKLRILKVPTGDGVDAEGFLRRGQALAGVMHPSVRRVRQVGRLADGRPFVLVDVPRGPALSDVEELSLLEAIDLGLQLTSAVEVLHRAGLSTGLLRATDVTLSRPAVLDASLASAGEPRTDTQSLVRLLLGAGLRRGADSNLRARLEALQSPTELSQLLRSMRALFVSTADVGAVTVEVLEPDLSGSRLGPWLLERVIGEGAIGCVYLARHQERPDAVAVKVLKREHAADAEVRHRFALEAQAVRAVRDEHFVEVYDYGQVDHPMGPVVYWAMELLHGEPLSEVVQRGPLAIERAVHITGQLALALHAAHQTGLVHRDVKPENVFLHRHGEPAVEQVKVLDFGLAKVRRPVAGLKPPGTQAGVAVGTPEYMAPEQAMGLEVDPRADLFAVGLVLYELLTGTRPYRAESFARRVVALTRTIAPRLPEVTPLGEPVPEALRAIVARCLEREPSQRFESGAELADALRSLDRPPSETARPRSLALTKPQSLSRRGRMGSPE